MAKRSRPGKTTPSRSREENPAGIGEREGLSEKESVALGKGHEGDQDLVKPRLAPQDEAAPTVESPHGDKDINVRGVAIFAASLAGILILSAAVVLAIMLFFRRQLREADPPPSPMPEANRPVVPPEPRLQENPVLDMASMRAQEDAVLRGYGWVDQNAGIARIPIERAIDLTLQGITVPKPAESAGDAADAGTPDGGTQ